MTRRMSLHTCSYRCERAECVKAQRDELRARVESDTALLRQALEALEFSDWYTRAKAKSTIAALRERLGEKG